MLFDEPTSALDPELVGEVLSVHQRPRGHRHDDDRGHPRDRLRPRGRRHRGLPRRRPDRRVRSARRAYSPAHATSAPARSSPPSCEPAAQVSPLPVEPPCSATPVAGRTTSVTTEGHPARRLRRPLLAAAAALAVACLVLAGCGSRQSSSAASLRRRAVDRAAPRRRPLDRRPDPGRRLRDHGGPRWTPSCPQLRSSGQLILGTTSPLVPRHCRTRAGRRRERRPGRRPAQRRRQGARRDWDVQNGTFATIIPGVQNGKYQVGQDNFGATKAREQVVDFATYLDDGQAFLGASSVSANSSRRSPSLRLHHRHRPGLDLPDDADQGRVQVRRGREEAVDRPVLRRHPRRSSSAWPTARSTCTSARR